MLRVTARRHRVPLVYANQVGGNDSLLFDGHPYGLDPQIPAFLEAGVLPTNVEVVDAAGTKSNKLIWIGEGRLGLRLG